MSAAKGTFPVANYTNMGVLDAAESTSAIGMNGQRASIQVVSSSFVGTWKAQVSNDGTNWENTSFIATDGGDIGVIEGPFRFIRVTATTYTSGSVTCHAIH